MDERERLRAVIEPRDRVAASQAVKEVLVQGGQRTAPGRPDEHGSSRFVGVVGEGAND